MGVKIGIALGAGGAKGLAHIGVLQVLKRENIPLDIIAGSSMGAAVGAAVAAGNDLDFLARLAVRFNHSLFVDVTIPRMGLMKGDKALEIIRLLTHNKNFDELAFPLAVTATDIERGERIVFREGNVALAVRASISIPGIFKPLRINDRLLVDGAVLERVPIMMVKDMGADFTIGVDVKACCPAKINIKNIYEVIMQSIDILEKEACKQYLDPADVMITPDMSHIGTLDFTRTAECIRAGQLAAEERIDFIREKLALRDA